MENNKNYRLIFLRNTHVKVIIISNMNSTNSAMCKKVMHSDRIGFILEIEVGKFTLPD